MTKKNFFFLNCFCCFIILLFVSNNIILIMMSDLLFYVVSIWIYYIRPSPLCCCWRQCTKKYCTTIKSIIYNSHEIWIIVKYKDRLIVHCFENESNEEYININKSDLDQASRLQDNTFYKIRRGLIKNEIEALVLKYYWTATARQRLEKKSVQDQLLTKLFCDLEIIYISPNERSTVWITKRP